MKPIDKRLKTLDEHIQNAEMYLRHRDIYSKLSRQYAALKDEVKEVEQIRKGVLQYAAAGATGTAAPQNTGYGTLKTGRRDSQCLSPPPLFEVLLTNI